MKKYYLHNGTESSGPFAIEELKAQKISKASPVWFEGMEKWKTAGEIEELAHLFIVVPPPFTAVPLAAKEEQKVAQHTILGLSKSTFFWVLSIFLLLVGTFIFDQYQQNRSDELEQKNKITERENQQYLLQQKEIEEKNNQIAAQEQLELERVAKERKQTIVNRLSAIEQLLLENNTALEEANIQLSKAKDFKLLRSSGERNEEISLIELNIEQYSHAIEKLKEESEQLKLELEKIR
jgi:hypothetical protein